MITPPPDVGAASLHTVPAADTGETADKNLKASTTTTVLCRQIITVLGEVADRVDDQMTLLTALLDRMPDLRALIEWMERSEEHQLGARLKITIR